MNDYERTVETTTIVKHSMQTPINWVELSKLLHVVLQEFKTKDPQTEPYDNQLWYEADEERIYLCYRLET